MRPKGSCTAKLSSWEKQLLLSSNSNGKNSTKCLLAYILYTTALNTDPDSCPPEVKLRPMKTIYSMWQKLGMNLLTQYRLHTLSVPNVLNTAITTTVINTTDGGYNYTLLVSYFNTDMDTTFLTSSWCVAILIDQAVHCDVIDCWRQNGSGLTFPPTNIFSP